MNDTKHKKSSMEGAEERQEESDPLKSHSLFQPLLISVKIK